MEDVLSKILDNLETIDELHDDNDNDDDPMQVVIDNLLKYVESEQQKLWLESVREVK